jgi:hypothetical protein
MRLRYDRWLPFRSPDHNITPALQLMLSHVDMSVNHNSKCLVPKELGRQETPFVIWIVKLKGWCRTMAPHHVVSVSWLLCVVFVRSEPGLAPRVQGQSLHNWDTRAKQTIWGLSKLFYALSICWTTALMLHLKCWTSWIPCMIGS